MSSCIYDYHIMVKNDGSAKVKTTTLDKDLNRYLRSQVISNIDTSGIHISFDISNIDSLGYYLPFFNPGYMSFKLNYDELIIENNNTEQVFTYRDRSVGEIRFYIELEKEITSTSSTNYSFYLFYTPNQ